MQKLAPKAALLLALFLPMTILGCAPKEAVPKRVKLAAPVVVDAAPYACPPAPASARVEARRGPPPPPTSDTVDGRGRPAISEDATRAWIDQYEIAIVRKNGVIRQLARELRDCRNGGARKTKRPRKRRRIIGS